MYRCPLCSDSLGKWLTHLSGDPLCEQVSQLVTLVCAPAAISTLLVEHADDARVASHCRHELHHVHVQLLERRRMRLHLAHHLSVIEHLP